MWKTHQKNVKVERAGTALTAKDSLWPDMNEDSAVINDALWFLERITFISQSFCFFFFICGECSGSPVLRGLDVAHEVVFNSSSVFFKEELKSGAESEMFSHGKAPFFPVRVSRSDPPKGLRL